MYARVPRGIVARGGLTVVLLMAARCTAPVDERPDLAETAGSRGLGGGAGGGPTEAGGAAGSGGRGGHAVTIDSGPDDAGDEAPPQDAAAESEPTDVRGPFRHPGVLVNRAQLDFVKAKIEAGEAPWSSAFQKAKGSHYGSLSYRANPRATVECGEYSNPDLGCSDEKDDVTAAYTHALLFALSGDAKYAEKSIEIMNAWSAVLKSHTNSNAPLQSGWCGSIFPRAAEIIRHAYGKWDPAEFERFQGMLRDVYLPEVVNGSPTTNGNWELTTIEATIGIGVFLDDRATFDKAVTMWRARVPAYIYMSADGATPTPPPGGEKSGAALVEYWYGQNMLMNGVGQETCRDLGHLQYGFAAMINAAETARLQGVDLYTAEQARITAGLEFNAQFLAGATVPPWLCHGRLSAVSDGGTWEIAYNAYAGRAGVAMPFTEQVVMKNRPSGTNHHMVWETLTHAGVGKVGIE
jgi:Alginate lyase